MQIPMDLFKEFLDFLVFVNFGIFPTKTCSLPMVEDALTINLMDSGTRFFHIYFSNLIMRFELEFSPNACDLDFFFIFRFSFKIFGVVLMWDL